MFVLDRIERLDLPMEASMKVELVLEELLTNVINYAYPPGRNGDMEVECSIGLDQCFRIVIRDWGAPFDPLACEDPDLTQDLSQREVGGLGIFLVRQMTDEISYRREEESNVLSLCFRSLAPIEA